MLKKFRFEMAQVITSELFPKLFLLSFVSFLTGFLFGLASSEKTLQDQCNNMSVTEAFKYPYCRLYFQEELKKYEY